MSHEFTNPKDVTAILEKEILGHLGCYSNGEIYVVPITMVCEDGYIYSHAPKGKKIEMMRKNPHVCIQVDRTRGLFDWESVIVWGDYEELHGDHAAKAMRLLIQRITAHEKEAELPSLEMDFVSYLERAIIYRIKIKKTTARYEGPLRN